MSDVEKVAAGEDNIEIDRTVKVSHLQQAEHSSDSPSSSVCGGFQCLSKVFQVFFSTPGLVVLVVLYSVMGAVLFPILEAPRDIKNSFEIARSREDCLKELWIITEKLNVLYEKNWTMLVHEQLRRFEGSIVAATRSGNGGLVADRAMWSFSEALVYSVTVITTIGHGNLTPRTSGGKIATILYALIGVPLMLMCLSSLGGLLAEALQCTYTRLCCSMKKVERKGSAGNGTATCTSAGAGADVGACDGQSHEMDCKLCKYDAVAIETKLDHNYHQYTTLSTSAGTEREAESCHLLRNSPMKVNHSSPCIQPHPAIKQYCIQRPDAPQFKQVQYTLSPSYNNYHQTSFNSHPNVVDGSSSSASSANNTTCIGSNCCPEIAGTATIYFPVGGVASNTAPSLQYGQPLVKYHTIQLQQHPKGYDSAMHMVTPQHHTATIHGIRRGRFLTKPMPSEINTLLAESDSSCRHEMPRESNSSNASGNVDIMEDEEENEQSRLSCPHGTPSRVPLLIGSSPGSTRPFDKTMPGGRAAKVKVVVAGGGSMSKLDNNRHQAARARQAAAVNTCNPIKSKGICGSDNCRRNGDDDAEDVDMVDCDPDDGEYWEDDENGGPQVPITVVFFILVSYICLGTVVFAFWENWSLVDGAYFCFVTLSTIGYGDFLPQQTFQHGANVQLFACCAYLLLGLVLVAMAFSILETQLMWKCKRIAVRLKLTNDG